VVPPHRRQRIFLVAHAVVLIKPPIALPVALTHLSRRGIIACAALLALSFAITPSWFWQWPHQFGEYHHFIPLLLFPGMLILLALLRLRDNDARLLLLAAAFPQRWFYDAFILWLIPKSRREIVASVGASWLVGLWRWSHPPLSFAQVGRWSVVGFYLPMLVITLLRRGPRGRLLLSVQVLIARARPHARHRTATAIRFIVLQTMSTSREAETSAQPRLTTICGA